MDSQKSVSQLRVIPSMFLFGTAATTCHKTSNKQLKDENITVCSNETYSTIHQWIKVRNSCRPTAMMRHRIWLKNHSPNSNNQTNSPSQTEGRKELSQPTNQCVQQPTKGIIRLILSNKKTKKTQHSKQGSSPIKLKTKTNKPRQKCHIQTLITRDTLLTSYHPISSALSLVCLTAV